MKQFNLNRKAYEAIKKFDHREMQNYINELQKKAYIAGQAEAAKTTITAAELLNKAAAEHIKGIGQAILLKLTHYAENNKLITAEEAAALYEKL